MDQGSVPRLWGSRVVEFGKTARTQRPKQAFAMIIPVTKSVGN